MTQEEKAKAWDIAIEKARIYYNSGDSEMKTMMVTCFPELGVSVDEKIRKELIEYLRFAGTPKRDFYIAWLEKQKPINEPRYKVGDWTIQDAKDGDVLVYSDSKTFWICIFKKLENNKIYDYCTYEDYDKGFWPHGSWNYYGSELNYTPATKEQRDLLFSKIKDAGYEWDAEKKELKKIEQNPAEWSNEDLIRLTDIIIMLRESTIFTNDVRTKCIDWLKSLNDRCIPQPKSEWNEVDERSRKAAIELLLRGKNNLDGYQEAYDDVIKWLKSLRPQNHWKPTEEQMKELKSLVIEAQKIHEESTGGYASYKILNSLYSDLKKIGE